MLDMNKVAKNIKNARTKKNMTQLELADIVGVSYQAVSNWERGNSMPDIGKISDIAKALDIDVTELLGNDNGTTAVKKVLEKSSEPLTAEELTDVAPMLPPMELTEEVKKTSEKEKLNIKALVGLAPYLDEEYLDEIASRVDEADIKDLVPLAPYLSDETMTNISKKITSSNIKDLLALAPFMSEEALDDVVSRIEGDNFEGVTALAPFLSKESLNSIVDKALEKGDVSDLTGIACFLGKGTLKKISEFLLKTDDTKNMSKFAQFL